MTAMEITFVLFGLAAAILLGLIGWMYLRRQALRRRFGPEYDRLVSESDSATEVDRELRDRERRHAELTLKELSPETRQWYSEQWQQLQSRFVQSPQDAVGAADELVTRLVADRGYPVGDYDEQVTLLSVEHSRTIGDYRQAHEVAQRHRRGQAETEELRQALVHFRTVVADLLGEDPVPDTHNTPSRSRRAS